MIRANRGERLYPKVRRHSASQSDASGCAGIGGFDAADGRSFKRSHEKALVAEATRSRLRNIACVVWGVSRSQPAQRLQGQSPASR